ncbi:ParB/Srx family N-terminal domain-containing protein [Snodgrassella sp. CFCC 13594]|uniref:ParB/Srx family N-terminal domain-containing protein n=1 Tax=Snodgrassella sp. CFCC 13594 TaxID=1775559 RepID=UPI00082EBC27|nr:ParB/Srx family N-terminal domain-containing protein [Snodgrassella sp. CFCC 13594]
MKRVNQYSASLLAFLCCFSTAIQAVETIATVDIAQLRPTQMSLGFDEVRLNAQQYRLHPQKMFEDYCQDNGGGKLLHAGSKASLTDPASFSCQQPMGTRVNDIKSAVLAPDGHYYLTDGHHSVSAYRAIYTQAGVPMRVRVTQDLRYLPNMSSFWQYLQQHHLSWLPEKKMMPNTLPTHIGMADLNNDVYRSVVYFLRKVAYQRPHNPPPFLEFYLADWLRQHLPVPDEMTCHSESYKMYVQQAALVLTQADKQQASSQRPGAPSLAQLGVYDQVNQVQLNKLLAKHGKLDRLFQLPDQRENGCCGTTIHSACSGL